MAPNLTIVALLEGDGAFRTSRELKAKAPSR